MFLLTIGLCPAPSFAQYIDLYDGTAAANKHFCQIVVTNPGVLSAGVDNLELSSKMPGGSAGTANVFATRSSYRLSIDAPLGFTSMPAGGGTGVNFSTAFSGYGSTNFSERPGNIEVKMKKGSTTVEAHFIAKRQSDPFPAGNYSAQLTLRCE